MQKKGVGYLIIFISIISFLSFSASNTYKCQIKMKKYTGEGAYIITSLINPEGAYVETLHVCGNDHDWFNEITNWWSFYGKRRNNIDAITGATISGGQQKVVVFEIDNDKINLGYKIRFETAVEDQEYYTKDVEIEFKHETVMKTISGSGFIDQVRIIPQL